MRGAVGVNWRVHSAYLADDRLVSLAPEVFQRAVSKRYRQ